MKQRIACIMMIFVMLLCLCSVSVHAEEEKIVINKDSINLYIGQSYQLSVTGTSSNIFFRSEDTKIADISGDGTVTANALGTTKVTAESDGMKAECTVNVLNGVSPRELLLDTQDITLKAGESYTLKATVKPAETDQKLTFTSSDKAVARVDNNGYIKALKAGVAVITVTSSSDAVSKKCIVKVNANTESEGATVTVKGSLYSIAGEKKVNMMVELRNSYGFKRTLTDENGDFSLEEVKQGDYAFLVYKTEHDVNPVAKTQMTVGAYHLNISCIMNGNDIVVLYQNNTAVASDIKEIVLAASAVSLNSGETYDMNYYARPSNAVLPTVMGISDDEEVAVVDADGRITAVSAGKATITFSTLDGKLSKSCIVTVEDANNNRYSGLIITIETALILLFILIFMFRYRKFVKQKEKEEFGWEEDES